VPQEQDGGERELGELRGGGFSSECVEIVGALIALRQSDRLSVAKAEEHPWIAGCELDRALASMPAATAAC